MRPSFVLVHSPIVGPVSWEPVAETLRGRGHDVLVPELPADDRGPWWPRHVAAVEATVGAAGVERVVLVAHSGAGPLLAQVGAAVRRRGVGVAAYVFVDAGLPLADRSRLEALADEDRELAADLRALLDDGGRYPTWGDEDLRPLVPDDRLRGRLVASIRRPGPDYWHERIPRVTGWPDAPCAVVLLSGAYASVGREAVQRGWPVRRLDGDDHFLTMVRPGDVAAAIEASVPAPG